MSVSISASHTDQWKLRHGGLTCVWAAAVAVVEGRKKMSARHGLFGASVECEVALFWSGSTSMGMATQPPMRGIRFAARGATHGFRKPHMLYVTSDGFAFEIMTPTPVRKYG